VEDVWGGGWGWGGSFVKGAEVVSKNLGFLRFKRVGVGGERTRVGRLLCCLGSIWDFLWV